MNNKPLVERKQLSMFALTWPIFIELLLAILVLNIDQWMLSMYSQDAVAAIGNASQILNVLTLTFTLISTAVTILVSQYIGAGETAKVKTVYTLGLTVNLGISVIVMTVVLLLSGQLFSLMQVPDELLDKCVSYMRIVGGFVFLDAMFSCFSAIFKTIELMRYTMYISVVINLMNIVGNYFLIFGNGPFERLGVEGAAISTVASRAVGVLLMILVFRRKSSIGMSLGSLRPFPLRELWKMIRIGVPSGGEAIAYDLSQMVILTFVNILGTAFGTYIISTRVYATGIAWITVIFAEALSLSTQIVIGRYVGAGCFDEAQRHMRRMVIVSACVTMCFSVLFFVFSRQILSLFTDDPNTISLGRTILLIEIFVDFGRCGNLVLVRSLQASGDTVFPVVLGICSMWCVSVVLAYVLGIVLGMGLAGVWIAMACDEVLRAIIFMFRVRSGRWRNRSFAKA